MNEGNYWKKILKRYLENTPENQWKKPEIKDILNRKYNVWDTSLYWKGDINKLKELSVFLTNNGYIEKNNFADCFLYDKKPIKSIESCN